MLVARHSCQGLGTQTASSAYASSVHVMRSRRDGFMSTDRDRGRVRKNSQSKRHAPKSGRRGVRLAPGVRLDDGGRKADVPVLVCPNGKVQLNGSALAILLLCDGSRNRDEIVAELATGSRRHTLAADIVAFLDVARARGWIIEP